MEQQTDEQARSNEKRDASVSSVAEVADAQVEASDICERREASHMTDGPQLQSSHTQSDILPTQNAAVQHEDEPMAQVQLPVRVEREPEPIPPPRRNKSASNLENQDQISCAPCVMMSHKFSGSAPNLATPPTVEPLTFPIIIPPAIPSLQKHAELVQQLGRDSMVDAPLIYFDE